MSQAELVLSELRISTLRELLEIGSDVLLPISPKMATWLASELMVEISRRATSHKRQIDAGKLDDTATSIHVETSKLEFALTVWSDREISEAFIGLWSIDKNIRSLEAGEYFDQLLDVVVHVAAKRLMRRDAE